MLQALPAFGRDRKAYMMRRTDSDMREWLDRWLIDREADGFLGELRTRWLGTELRASPHPLASLFALIDTRLAMMPAVADYKRRSNLPIEDTQQEQAVLTHVATLARSLGVNEQDVQNVFRVQIELAKQVQQTALQNSTDGESIPPWAHGLDLNTDLRPTLGELNDRIVYELAWVFSALYDQALLQQLVNEEITVSGVSLDGKRQLADVLLAVGNKRRGINEQMDEWGRKREEENK
jgi:chorismate mutase-like protein